MFIADLKHRYPCNEYLMGASNFPTNNNALFGKTKLVWANVSGFLIANLNKYGDVNSSGALFTEIVSVFRKCVYQRVEKYTHTFWTYDVTKDFATGFYGCDDRSMSVCVFSKRRPIKLICFCLEILISA